MDWNGGGIMSNDFMASTHILFDQCEGKVTQPIFPQGELTYEYTRSPVNLALAEEGRSEDDWLNIAQHQTKANRLIMVNIQSLTGAGKNKGSFIEVSNFMDLKGHAIRVSAGNKKGSNGKASITETIKTDGNGNASFNQAFLFLAQPGVQACEVSVKQKGMLGASEYGKLTIGLEQQRIMGALKVKDATLAIQTTFVDLDVGVSALINSYRRAAREAELRAIAERERQEAEEQRKAAEAAAAALLAAQKLKLRQKLQENRLKRTKQSAKKQKQKKRRPKH